MAALALPDTTVTLAQVVAAGQFTVPGTIEKRLDAASEHGNGAAAMREQPFDVAHAGERAAEQQADNRARGIVRHLDHGGEGADTEPAAAARHQRMNVNDGLAPVPSKIGL